VPVGVLLQMASGGRFCALLHEQRKMRAVSGKHGGAAKGGRGIVPQ